MVTNQFSRWAPIGFFLASLAAGLSGCGPSPQAEQPPAQKPTGPAHAAPGAGHEEAGGRTLFDGESLNGWRPADFFGSGKVHVKDGVLVMERGKLMTGIFYTRNDFPKMDYEV